MHRLPAGDIHALSLCLRISSLKPLTRFKTASGNVACKSEAIQKLVLSVFLFPDITESNTDIDPKCNEYFLDIFYIIDDMIFVCIIKVSDNLLS